MHKTYAQLKGFLVCGGFCLGQELTGVRYNFGEDSDCQAISLKIGDRKGSSKEGLTFSGDGYLKREDTITFHFEITNELY